MICGNIDCMISDHICRDCDVFLLKKTPAKRCLECVREGGVCQYERGERDHIASASNMVSRDEVRP